MINVGIIGLGFMGMMHLKNYIKNDKARVIALCDLNKKRKNIQKILQTLGNVSPRFN